MNRAARALLTVGATTCTMVGVTALLLRKQSHRLRELVDADAGSPTPPTLAVVGDDAVGQSILPDGTALPAVAVLGDSWLCGDRHTRPGMLIARGLSTMLERPVRLYDQSTASAGAEDVSRQTANLLNSGHKRQENSQHMYQEHDGSPRYAVVSMGTTDIMHPVSGTLTIPVLTSTLNRLEHEGGYRVIVLTCPDLGSLPSVRQPLRGALRRSSRVLSGSQWLTAVSAGALPVSVHQSLSGTAQVGLIAKSGYRPSRLGYQQIAAAVLSRIAHDQALTVTATADGNCDVNAAPPSNPRPATSDPAPPDSTPATTPEEAP